MLKALKFPTNYVEEGQQRVDRYPAPKSPFQQTIVLIIFKSERLEKKNSKCVVFDKVKIKTKQKQKTVASQKFI